MQGTFQRADISFRSVEGAPVSNATRHSFNPIKIRSSRRPRIEAPSCADHSSLYHACAESGPRGSFQTVRNEGLIAIVIRGIAFFEHRAGFALRTSYPFESVRQGGIRLPMEKGNELPQQIGQEPL